jgi:hypothetical protein
MEAASGEAEKVTGSRFVEALTGVNGAACCDAADEIG